MARETRLRIRNKRKDARESPQRGFQVPPRSALPPGLYSSTRLTVPDRDEDLYSTAGTDVGDLSSRVSHEVNSSRLVYLDENENDDDLSTVASDTTWRPPELGDQPLEDVNYDDQNDDDRTRQLDGSIDETLCTINGKTIASADIFLTFEGVTNVRHIDGDIRQYLFNDRFALSDKDVDYAVWVKKNLIVTFQGHLLYEDCLVTRASNNMDESKNRILSRLQEDVGLPVDDKNHFLLLRAVLHIYKDARVDAIARALQGGFVPQDPQDPLTALLIKLIDRYIMYSTDKIPLRSMPPTNTVLERVEQRSKLLRDTLANSSKTSKLFSEFGCLIPSEECGLISPRPWLCESWVRANVADVMHSLTNARQGLQQSRMVLNMRENRKTERVEIPRVMPNAGQILPQKRDHSGGAAGQPQLEPEAIMTTNKMEHWTHEHSEAVESSKRQKLSKNES